MQRAEQIGRAEKEGICSQMMGLAETGLCMLAAGSSRPAGGSEHHLSHFWEMKLLREGRPAILHGAKVGAESVVAAGSTWRSVTGSREAMAFKSALIWRCEGR